MWTQQQCVAWAAAGRLGRPHSSAAATSSCARAARRSNATRMMASKRRGGRDSGGKTLQPGNGGGKQSAFAQGGDSEKAAPSRAAATAGDGDTEEALDKTVPSQRVLAGGNSADESQLPEIVSQRMLRRMVVLCGVPFLLGVAGFGTFFYLKAKYDIVFQPGVVATSTLGMFGVALFGLTYGILSASWEPEREGGILGAAEVRKNLTRVRDGLGRARLQERVTDDMDESERRKRRSK